jgi:release factor glutamine methyltransferase
MNRRAFSRSRTTSSAESPLGSLLIKTERRLAAGGLGDSRIEADLIWMTALDVGRAELYARLNQVPSPEQASAADALIQRRLRHEFYGIELSIAPGVLIPRPDTETLVEEALRVAGGAREALTIADVGCGSGAIAVALALHLPDAAIYAIDTSPRALEITRLNSERHGVVDRIRVCEGDLLDPLPAPVDLIVANLPYVASWEIPTLDPEIRLYEPREALDGGDNGLDLIRRLLTAAPACLRPSGTALLEMDPRQIDIASAFATKVMPGASVRTVRDLTGRERVLTVET